MAGSQQLFHQWVEGWTEMEDIPEETAYCPYCEEPCSGSFLGASPIWRCMWCQRLVHIECHANMATESDDICDLGPYKRLILSPLCVKDLDKKTEANGFLSSITHRANELASSVRGRIRKRIGDCDNDGRNKAYILGQNCTSEDRMTPFIHGNQLAQSTGQQRREMKGFRNRKMMGSSQDWSCNLLRPPPQNYESISAKQESREKTTLDRSSVPKLVKEIDEKLNKEKVECMICYEIVGRSAPIWSGGNWYAIFHLHCVRKWARAPSSVDLSAGQSQDSNWRCPGRQSVQLSFPDDLRYYCFCGKVQEPEVEFYLTCPCGKTTITKRCSDHKSIESCGQCRKLMRSLSDVDAIIVIKSAMKAYVVLASF